MPHIFISHASADDPFVAELRQELEALQFPVWVDFRNLRGGSKLAPEIETAIVEASHVLAVLSPSTVNSPWVRREIRKALEVEKSRGDGYRVIPLLLPGLTLGALEAWFDEEPVESLGCEVASFQTFLGGWSGAPLVGAGVAPGFNPGNRGRRAVAPEGARDGIGA